MCLRRRAVIFFERRGGALAISACPFSRRQNMSTTCCGVEMRFSGLGAHMRFRMCATDDETSGRIVLTSGIPSPLIAFARSSTTEHPALGRCPVSISKKTIPSE